jgi:hypothetical protein
MRRLIALPVFLFVMSAVAQKAAPLSGDQILKNIEANYDGIQDYTVALEVTVDLDRLKVPKMQATMFYKRPDKVRFKSEGFALLPKDGVGFTPGNLRTRFEVLTIEEKKAELQYVLTMALKSDKTKLRRAIAMVNASNWTVSRIVTPQRDARQMRAEFEYEQVDGHWLPAQLKVLISPDTADKEQADPFGQMPGAQRSSQPPRKGSISVRYSDYQLNTGLKDDVFEQSADDIKK